jgi:hypothetical protein
LQRIDDGLLCPIASDWFLLELAIAFLNHNPISEYRGHSIGWLLEGDNDILV